jgi:hypothetical protein
MKTTLTLIFSLVTFVTFSQVAFVSHKQYGKIYNASTKEYEIKAQDTAHILIHLKDGVLSICKAGRKCKVFTIISKGETVNLSQSKMMYYTVKNNDGVELIFSAKFNLTGTLIYSLALMTTDTYKVLLFTDVEDVTKNFKEKSETIKN